MKVLIAVLAILAAVAGCDGRTITVDDDGPADFSTIQAAIDDSNDGDTVLVADGTYTGDDTGASTVDLGASGTWIRSCEAYGTTSKFEVLVVDRQRVRQ